MIYNITLVLRFSEVRNFNNFKISSEGNTHYLVCQDTTGELVVENSPTAEKALVDYLITQEKLFEFSDNLEVDTDFFEKYGYWVDFSR